MGMKPILIRSKIQIFPIQSKLIRNMVVFGSVIIRDLLTEKKGKKERKELPNTLQPTKVS